MTDRPAGGSAAALVPALTLVVVAACVTLSAGRPGFVPEYWGDEFMLPWYGKQVLLGRVPYVDFFMFLGPLAAYGPAALEWLTAVGIAPFRLLNVAVVTVATLSLHRVALQRGAPRGTAWCIAAWLPLLLFAVWPMSSHQWIAVSLGLAAVAVAGRAVSPAGAAVAGALAAASGLMVQTVGVIALPVVLAVTRMRAVPGRSTAAVIAGAGGPFIACAAVLLLQSAFAAFLRYAVLWPSSDYVQQGGFNDGSLALLIRQRPILTALSGTVPGSDLLVHLLIVPLGILALAVAAAGAVGRTKDARSRRSALLLLACVVTSFLVFEAGRSDMPHLAYVSPVFLAILAGLPAQQPRLRRVLNGFLIIGVLVGGARWTLASVGHPPDPRAVLAADRHIADVIDDALIEPLPGARAAGQPIIYLSRAASVLYVYWSPEPPPIEWVAAPSWGTNTEEQYSALAEFLRTRRIPWVIVSGQDEGILEDPSPLRDVLRADYREERRIAAGVVLVPRVATGGLR